MRQYLPRVALMMMSSAGKDVRANEWEPLRTCRRMGNWGGWEMDAAIFGGHFVSLWGNRICRYSKTQQFPFGGISSLHQDPCTKMSTTALLEITKGRE